MPQVKELLRSNDNDFERGGVTALLITYLLLLVAVDLRLLGLEGAGRGSNTHLLFFCETNRKAPGVPSWPWLLLPTEGPLCGGAFGSKKGKIELSMEFTGSWC